MPDTIDYYELLEVERTADDKTIKSAYRRIAMQCHPDKNPGCKDSEAKFKAVSRAYECLKDPQKRAAYDRYGKAAYEQAGSGGGGGRGGPEDFGGFSDIFEGIFGEFMGGGRGRPQQRRGADLRYDMEITLEDAFHGKDAEVSIEVAAACDTCDGTGAKSGTAASACRTCGGMGKVRGTQGFFVVERVCPTCHGAGQVIADPCTACRGEGRIDKSKTLSVKVPAGVDEGTRIRLSGEGEAGPRGSPPGDLYIFLHVARHKRFAREGTTLVTRVPIGFGTAALGGVISVEGLDGAAHEIRVPAGIQSGKQVRQRGAGMPVLNGRGAGDLIVQIDVETPTKLDPRSRELLEELRAIEVGHAAGAEPEGFFSKLKGRFAE
jgi:molecular chaperone DnaJ